MKRTYTDKDLVEAVQSSLTWSQVGRKLGNESRAIHAKTVADKLGLDYSHFTGRAVSKKARRDDAAYLELAAQERVHRTGGVKLALFRTGIKDRKCERCNLDTWQGEPIPLSLDHIDGDNLNNKLDNLRILCENCHGLTPTWRGRGKKKQARVV